MRTSVRLLVIMNVLLMLAVGICLVMLTSGRAAGAAAPAATQAVGSISACANKQTGVLRLLSKGKCAASEVLITWNQTGPRGPKGDRGDTGATGSAGATGDTGAPGEKGDPGAACPNTVEVIYQSPTSTSFTPFVQDARYVAFPIPDIEVTRSGLVYVTPYAQSVTVCVPASE